MPDLFWIADLGRASVAAFWIPVAAWTAVALVVEAALRLGKTGAALALPVRGAVLAALPLAVLLPAGLDALVPEAAQAMAVLGPGLMWLPEVAVGAAPEARLAVLDVLGRTVTTARVVVGPTGDAVVSTAGFAPGTYLVRVIRGDRADLIPFTVAR